VTHELDVFWRSFQCQDVCEINIPSFHLHCIGVFLFFVWHLMLVSEEDPSSQRYDVENCIEIDKAFLATRGYSKVPLSHCLLAVYNNNSYPRGLA
jgi:hypothetical protein